MRSFRVLPVKLLACILCVIALLPGAMAATTSLHIVKYDPDGVTILNETEVSYEWMEQNLQVYGDGITHYFLQGPVFLDDPDPAKEEELRWNPREDTNVQEKDMGAVRGTNMRDLCELVGGMRPGDMVVVKAIDGFSRGFSYRNVYEPPPRQGPIILAWWTAEEGYVPRYREGMRLLFFADNSTNPWGIHALGAWDWHESAEEQYWYYYRQGEEIYPTTTGISVQYVSEIRIRSAQPVKEPLSPFVGIFALGILFCVLNPRREHH